MKLVRIAAISVALRLAAPGLVPAVNAASPPPSASTNHLASLHAWLHSQTNLATWSATFTQIRSLRSLKQPLLSHGHVQFAAPNLFRWEITHPSPAIALRLSNQVAILYPNLQRLEWFPLDSSATGPWKEALAIFDAGFPRSLSDLEKRFRVLPPTQARSSNAPPHLLSLRLEPRNAAARKWLPEIELEFDPALPGVHSTQIKLGDGSTLKNIFSNSVVNPTLNPATFEIPKDHPYHVVSPAAPTQPR